MLVNYLWCLIRDDSCGRGRGGGGGGGRRRRGFEMNLGWPTIC